MNRHCVHCEYDFTLIAIVIVYIFALGPPYGDVLFLHYCLLTQLLLSIAWS